MTTVFTISREQNQSICVAVTLMMALWRNIKGTYLSGLGGDLMSQATQNILELMNWPCQSLGSEMKPQEN